MQIRAHHYNQYLNSENIVNEYDVSNISKKIRNSKRKEVIKRHKVKWLIETKKWCYSLSTLLNKLYYFSKLISTK